MKFEEFEENITKWSNERGLLDAGKIQDITGPIHDELIKSKQLNKLMEEVGELSEDFNKRDADEEHMRHMIDSIGDTLVTLTTFAHQNGLSMEQCYDKAWSHIKNRKGKMIDGTFVKSDDING